MGALKEFCRLQNFASCEMLFLLPLFITQAIVHFPATRGGKICPTRWASPVRPKLGPGWAIKLLARKKIGPNLARPGPAWPNFFWPLKDYLARPARFLGRAGLLKYWPTVGPTQPDPARPIATSTCDMLLFDSCCSLFGFLSN